MELNIIEIKRLVRSILTDDIRSRCSDKWLYTKCLEIMQIEGLTASEKEQLIYLLRKAHLPRFATVMRSRQLLQAREPSLTENATKQKRKELEAEYRKEFSSNDKQ